MPCQQLQHHNSVHQLSGLMPMEKLTHLPLHTLTKSVQGCCVQIGVQATEFNTILSAACSSRIRHSTASLHTAHSNQMTGWFHLSWQS